MTITECGNFVRLHIEVDAAKRDALASEIYDQFEWEVITSDQFKTGIIVTALDDGQDHRELISQIYREMN